MSTRAYVGVRIVSTNQIKFIYMHHGHPSDIGGNLLSDYCSEIDVLGLIIESVEYADDKCKCTINMRGERRDYDVKGVTRADFDDIVL